MTTKTAILWTALWVGVSTLVGGLIYGVYGQEASMTFFAVYLIEKTLSFDNLFVFLLIFSYFKTPNEYKHKILMCGIAGAIVFRAIFIFSGSALFARFEWLLYVLGALLIYLGIKLFASGDDGNEDVSKSFAVRFAKKYLSVEDSYCGGSLTTKNHELSSRPQKWLTLTFMVIVVVEISDIIFAIDSVPAAFAITSDPVLIYLANICAILGLRSLFFVMDSIIDRLRFINYGVGVILIFIGAKNLTNGFIHIDPTVSMIGILTVLGVTFSVSFIFPSKQVLTQ